MLRLNMLGFGSRVLVAFLLAVTVFVCFVIKLIMEDGIGDVIKHRWAPLLLIGVGLAIVFWYGIITVYVTSAQLGVKMRLIGIICGLIPVVHLVVLIKIIGICLREESFEKSKILKDRERASEQVCKTKYPILMVHGVFFRDFAHFNYWGRIPAELEKNGATIFYGNHQSAASVDECAEELTRRIEEIVKETGCEKVNIIAHSKGGLDSKVAVTKYGAAPYVASITTINTPHKGCEFAEYLLGKAPEGLRKRVASAYNTAFKKLGDENPDFIEAVTDLTASRTQSISGEADAFDYKAAGIFTQSVGSCMKKATSGAFPLNMSYLLVNYFDGPNDGLVGEPSFHWGEKYTFLQNKIKRGISHGDVIDLNRENIPGFDVREFYVDLVSDLKNRAL